ncbi:MAG: NAD-dependent epimerase/dehydratase family protein [Bacteroidota bacterium]
MNICSLVTGGAGFIGSHVVDYLIEAGHEVIVLDDLSGGNKSNIHSEARLYIGSITDVSIVNALFDKYQFTYVYHLAAYAAEGLSHFIRRFNYENNLIGSTNLINASINHKIKCFVFTSSIAVYGTNKLPLNEIQVPNPEDPYGIAKYAVEMDLAIANRMFGLDSIIFRPHNVYGERQNIGDKYRNVIGIFMNQLLQHKPMAIFGDGSQTRAFSYVGDVAPYIANSVNVEGAYNQIFNIGSDDFFSLNELAESVANVMSCAPEIEYLPKRNEVEHAYADHLKFQSVFNPNPDIKLVDGLQRMATWVRNHGSQKSVEFEDIEVKKNLPDSWK